MHGDQRISEEARDLIAVNSTSHFVNLCGLFERAASWCELPKFPWLDNVGGFVLFDDEQIFIDGYKQLCLRLHGCPKNRNILRISTT